MRTIRFSHFGPWLVLLTILTLQITGFGQVIAGPIAQQAYVKASNAEANDQFGASVAISGDTMVVGAPKENSNAAGVNGDQNNNRSSYSGAAYVFVRTGGGWTQQAYLKASTPGIDDRFGSVVAISGDTIVVGAPQENGSSGGINGDQSKNQLSDAGAVYVFVRNGGVWTQQAYIKASVPGEQDFFGSSVGISGDSIVVGAPLEDSAATGVNGNQNNNTSTESGAAYVFTRSDVTWRQEAYLKAGNTGKDDFFGSAVAIAGETVVVGAPQESGSGAGAPADNSLYHAGAAYVFRRSGGVWNSPQYVKPSQPQTDALFGAVVSATEDTVLVASPYGSARSPGGELVSSSGLVSIFAPIGAGWAEQATLKAGILESSDAFGISLGIDGNLIIVGAQGEDGSSGGVNGDQSLNGLQDSGAAFVFEKNGNAWTQLAYLKAAVPQQGGFFGASTGVAVSGGTAVVGAPRESSRARGVNGEQTDRSALESGAAFVFTGLDLAPAPGLTISQRQGRILSPGAVVDMGAISLGATGSPVSFTIRNVGTVELKDLALSLSGTNPGDFTVTQPLATTLAPAAATTFTVSFTPGAVGARVGTLRCVSNDSGNSPFDLILMGSGTSGLPFSIAETALKKPGALQGIVGFGSSVAISGNTVIVGTPGDNNGVGGVNPETSNESARYSGAAYIFTFDGANWTQEAYLKARYPGGPGSFFGVGDTFGSTVAISGDTVVIGAPEEDSRASGIDGDGTDNSLEQSGAAYVFTRRDGVWAQEAYLKAAVPHREDRFGTSVGISGDRIVIGAPTENSNATGVNGDQTNTSRQYAGAAYVFHRSQNGWRQEAYLKASRTTFALRFGLAVAISGDTAVIGSNDNSSAAGVNGNQNNDDKQGSGAVHVFVLENDGWKEQAFLKASNPDIFDGFGSALAISGHTLIVGAPAEASLATGVDGNQGNNAAPIAGATYIFARSGGVWAQQAYLKASNTEEREYFGTAVAVSGDTAVVGAYYEDGGAVGLNGDASSNSAPQSGAAYIYTRSGSSWILKGYLKSSTTRSNDNYARAVAIDGSHFVVGADGSGGTNQGEAHFYMLLTPPETVVMGNATSIANGDPTPDIADLTDFGGTPYTGGSVTRSFQIANSGGVNLILGTALLSGPDAADFSIVTQTVSLIAGGAANQLVVTFNPSTIGLKKAGIRFSTNDPAAPLFQFDIQGSGLNTAPVSVSQTLNIPEDSSLDLTLQGTDLDGDALSFRITSPPPSELVTMTGTLPHLKLIPSPDFNGTVNFGYTVSDGLDVSVESRITIVFTPVNDAPDPIGVIPPQRAIIGKPLSMDLAAFFKDRDGDSLRYEVVSNRMPGAATANITGSMLRIEAISPGGTDLTLRAFDAAEASAVATFFVSTGTEFPTISAMGAPIMERQTGLFLQNITVTNTTGLSLEGCRIRLSGLPAGARLYSASNPPASAEQWVDYAGAMPPGASFSQQLSYFVPNRNPGFVPILTMENLEAAPDLTSTGEGREVSRVVKLADGGFLLEFDSVAGLFYKVEYSPDLIHWKLSPTSVQAGGNRVQWIDRGPPNTDAPPASVPARYYRIRNLPP